LDDVYDYSANSDSFRKVSYMLEPEMKYTLISDGKDAKTEYFTIANDTVMTVTLNQSVIVSYATIDKNTGKWTTRKVNKNDKEILGYNKQKQKVISMQLNNQVQDGTFYIFANNKIIYSIYAKDGEEQSDSKTYYPSGKLKYESKTKFGVEDGVSKYFAEDGKLLIEANYLEGNLYGDYKYWDAKSQTYKTVNVDYNIFPELDQVY